MLPVVVQAAAAALALLLAAVTFAGDVLLRLYRRRHPLPPSSSSLKAPSLKASSSLKKSSSAVAPRQHGAHHHVAEDGVVRLADGRLLGYRDHRPLPHAGGTKEAEEEEDAVVFYLHGLMGSRLEFFGYRKEFGDRHVRIVTVDRPGYGMSTYAPTRRLVDFADDLLALADHLAVKRFAVVGWSSGGCYALACAARLPTDRLIDVATISCDPPWYSTPWKLFPLHHRILAAFAWNAPSLLHPLFAGLVRFGLPFVVMRDARLAKRIFEANRYSVRASFKEMILERSPWGFNLRDVTRLVHLYHGDKDTLVPVEAMAFLASQLPNTETHLERGQGHEIASVRWGHIVLALTHRQIELK